MQTENQIEANRIYLIWFGLVSVFGLVWFGLKNIKPNKFGLVPLFQKTE